MINLQAEYIQAHKKRNSRTVNIEVVVEEDYNPETDGFHCHLISSSAPLSMPQDMTGDSDIDEIMLHLGEAIDEHRLVPGTVYGITMIECEEYDGAPMLMTTWAVQEVCMHEFA